MSIPRRSFFGALLGAAAPAVAKPQPVGNAVTYGLRYPLCCGERMRNVDAIDVPSGRKTEFRCDVCQRSEWDSIWVPVKADK